MHRELALPRGAFRFGLILAFLALAGAGKVQAGDRLLWRSWGVRGGLRGRLNHRMWLSARVSASGVSTIMSPVRARARNKADCLQLSSG